MPVLVTRDWLRGYIEGLQAYAWMKDGTYYVGTCGTTLREAIENAKQECLIKEEVEAK